MSAKKPSIGLGRGFDTLIPQNFDPTVLLDEKERIQKLFTRQIRPHANQPRQHFDQTSLQELAASIRQYGVLQPIVVTPIGHDKYELIAGERRWRAAQMAGLEHIPAIVRSAKKLEQLEIALIENVQRVDLTPLEQAASIQRLHEQFSMDYNEISRRLGKAISTINNIVRLLQLPPSAQEALQEGRITEGHARTILSLKPNLKLQEELLLMIQTRHWNVRQAEQFVNGIKTGVTKPKEAHTRTTTTTPATESLSKVLNVPVSIKRTAKGGRLEIAFRSDEDLEDLIKRLTDLLNKN